MAMASADDYPGLDDKIAAIVGSNPVLVEDEPAEPVSPELSPGVHPKMGEAEPAPEPIPTESPEGGTPGPDDSPADPGEPPPSEPSTADPEALHGAYSALYRDGLPKTVVEKMTEDEVLVYGAKAQKRQADADSAYRERDQLRNSTKDGTAEATEEPATAQSTGDTSSVLREAVADLGEKLGEDEAASVQRLLDTAWEHMILPQMQGQIKALDDLAFRMLQRDVQGDIPELAKAENFARVKEQALALMRSDLHADLTPVDRLDQMIRLSARAEGYGMAPSPPAADPSLRKNGHLESGGARVPKREMPETYDDSVAAKARAIVAGASDPSRLIREFGR